MQISHWLVLKVNKMKVYCFKPRAHCRCFFRGPIRNAAIRLSGSCSHSDQFTIHFISNGSAQDGEFKDRFTYLRHHISKNFCQYLTGLSKHTRRVWSIFNRTVISSLKLQIIDAANRQRASFKYHSSGMHIFKCLILQLE